MTRLLALIALAACVLAGCPAPEGRPRRGGNLKTAIRPARVADASFERLALRFDVEFDNASPASLTAASVDYTLSLAARPWTDQTPWSEGKTGQGVAVKPRATTVVPITIDVPCGKLLKAMPALARDPQLGYVIRAAVHLQTAKGGTVTVPLRGQGVVAVPFAPTIELARLEVRRLDVAAARLDLVLRATNPNAFRATIKQVKAEVDIAGTRVGQVDLTPNAAIAAGGAVELAAPLALDFRRLGAKLHTAIASGNVDVRLAGTVRVLIPYGEPTLSLAMTKKMPVTR